MRTLHTTQFTIGSTVWCGDGACGRLRQVVIEPIDRVLTHLVVRPERRGREPRLVPLGFVEPPADRAAPEEIVLHCSLAEFETFERALETHFLAGASGHWGYRQEQMLTWPHYRLGLDGGLVGRAKGPDERADTAQPAADTSTRTHDRELFETIQVRRGDRVQAVDGPIGRVQGLVVDHLGHQVTHVLLDESHLWDQKRAAIPIGAVTDVRHGLRINLTKDQVGNLPPVELDIQE
jgi:hypothetical protein